MIIKKDHLIRMLKDAQRWQKLISLVKTNPEVKLRTSNNGDIITIAVGEETYYIERGTFDTVIDSIPDPKKK